MTPAQSLLMVMVEVGMEIRPGTLESLQESILDGNIYFFDKDGNPTGFVTWYFECNDVLVVNNLCLFSSGINKLFELRNMFHVKYPNLSKVKWWNEKYKREVIYGCQQNEQHNRPVSTAKNTSV